MKPSILLIQPFRKPKFKEIVVKNHPFWEVINTSPLLLGAVLEDAGYKVNFLSTQNAFRSYESSEYSTLTSLLSEYNPDIIIICTDYYMANGSTASFFSIKKITDYYKKTNPNIKTILVGRNGIALGRKIFDIDTNIDIVVKGECEECIVSLIDDIQNNNLLQTPNIFYKDGNEIIENKGVGRIKDINVMPTPAFHLLKSSIETVEKVVNVKMRSVPVCIRTSYGCPMSCNFCAGIENWTDYYTKSKETIEKEVKYFFDVFGEKGKIFFLADEVFAYKLEHVSDVVDVFKKYNVKLSGLFAHARLFNDELAKKLKEITDCVVFGAENCCNEILELANKKQTFEDVEKAIETAKRNDLSVSLEWIVGLPGENIKTACSNLNKIYKLLVKQKVDNINTYVFCPHPNTEFFNNNKKYGINIIGDYDDMLEEGGFPTYSLESLSSNQIYIYYLLSQLIIKETQLNREIIRDNYEPSGFNLEKFQELFSKIGED